LAFQKEHTRSLILWNSVRKKPWDAISLSKQENTV